MSTPVKYLGYTKGPWEIGLVDHQHDISLCRNHMLLLPGNDAIYITGTNQEANARLVADAPTLLAERDRLTARVKELEEALQGLLSEMVEYGTSLSNAELRQGRVDAARAILAKGGKS